MGLKVFTTPSVPLTRGQKNSGERGCNCPTVLFFRKSPRPSFLIKRAALGNLKASFHCTHWHRFFPLKRAPPLTPTLSPSGEREETALLGARNRYALRMAGHQSPRQIVRDGTAGGIAVYS